MSASLGLSLPALPARRPPDGGGTGGGGAPSVTPGTLDFSQGPASGLFLILRKGV